MTETIAYNLTQAQHDSLLDTISGWWPYTYVDTAQTTLFNPIKDCNEEWTLFQGDLDFCDRPELQWIKNLPSKEWCPKPPPPPPISSGE